MKKIKYLIDLIDKFKLTNVSNKIIFEFCAYVFFFFYVGTVNYDQIRIRSVRERPNVLVNIVDDFCFENILLIVKTISFKIFLYSYNNTVSAMRSLNYFCLELDAK